MERMAWILTAVAIVGGLSWAENLAPNGGFEDGADNPAGWKMVGGKGQLESTGSSGRGISVTGTGQDNPYWAADAKGVQAGKAYRLSFQAKTTGSGGNMICGLDHINRDFQPGSQWAKYTYIFTPKKDPLGCIIRLGQWQRNDTTFFDEVSLTEVTPIHDRKGSVELGEGESIQNGIYTFNPDFDCEGSNVSRPLFEFTCGFNTNRWTVGPGQWVIYRHRVGDVQQVEPTVRVNVGYFSSGQCIVECSGDGNDWKELGRIGKVEAQSFSLPKEFSGRNDVWIRILGSAAKDPQGAGSFQVYGYTYSARLNGPFAEAIGQTHFMEILKDEKGPVQVELLSCGSLIPDENQVVRFQVRNTSAEKHLVRGSVLVSAGESPLSHPVKMSFYSPHIVLPPHSEQAVEVKYDFRRFDSGSLQANIELCKQDGKAGDFMFSAATHFSIPALHAASYGYPGGVNGPLSWWWCEGTYKVSRQRLAPIDPSQEKGMGGPMSWPRSPVLSACRGEYEPVQIVLRPTEPLKQVTVSVKGSDSIPTSAIKAHRVAYHFVHRASDSTGCIGWWPDALPEWNEPVDLAADENQPIWVLVKIPRECKERSSQIQVKVRSANQPEIKIPIDIRVYDFEMPPKSHVESGFGISPGNIRRYHNLQTQDEERKVWDLYMQSFREHRIAPYHFAPYDPIGVQWQSTSEKTVDGQAYLKAELDFAAWDTQAERYLNRADGFASFMLPLQGTGGGTYESRSPGKIGPFEQGSDGYRRAFASYCGAIQQHLQDKGWLGKEYIYWFDEPEPKDYDFVRSGMDEIRRAGPKLRRMLTEEPIEPLFGSVDLWCPILDQYNPEIAQARQAKGETIWWYVCTGPRAPYPGLFIDHSAIDLRIWLWMTWKWKVQGILVWESTYWTSDKAFPAPKMQNPWADPMGYIGGYSFEPGFVGYWGNGDGRFLYPPNRDVENDKSKYMTGPVSSIRWEMLRDGLEDYEYFWLLREAIERARQAGKPAELLSKATALLEVGPDLVTDKTHFTQNPQLLYQRRIAVAEMIESLQ